MAEAARPKTKTRLKKKKKEREHTSSSFDECKYGADSEKDEMSSALSLGEDSNEPKILHDRSISDKDEDSSQSFDPPKTLVVDKELVADNETNLEYQLMADNETNLECQFKEAIKEELEAVSSLSTQQLDVGNEELVIAQELIAACSEDEPKEVDENEEQVVPLSSSDIPCQYFVEGISEEHFVNQDLVSDVQEELQEQQKCIPSIDRPVSEAELTTNNDQETGSLSSSAPKEPAVIIGSPGNLNELAARTLISSMHTATNCEEHCHLGKLEESVIIQNTFQQENDFENSSNRLSEIDIDLSSQNVASIIPESSSAVLRNEDSLLDSDLQQCNNQMQDAQSPGQCALLQLDADDEELASNIPLMAEVQRKGMPLMAATEAYEEQCWDVAYEHLNSPSETDSASANLSPKFSSRQVNAPRCIQPLTRIQLRSLYYNNELAVNEELINNFVQEESNNSNHEFDEILTNYYRACKKLINAENTVRLQQENHKKYRKGLWQTVQEHVVVQGYCKDNSRCVVRHLYEKSEMEHSLFEKIGKTLQSVRNSIEDELSLQAYSAQLSRLQVESYIHNLFKSLPILQKIRADGPIRVQAKQSMTVLHQIQRLKDCISILFSMHRRPIDDHNFVENLRIWTERLVSVLLRVASFEDHLFLLNHILRCPAGVGSWAAQYIQIPLLANTDETTFVSPSLDHMVTVLATILQPIKGREQFLQHLNTNLKERTESNDGAWIMVDSDGEENEDPKNAWQYLRENDVVNMLGQVALNELFQHVLMMTLNQDSSWHYDVNVTSESIMMKTFAFFTCLIDILSCGLKTFSLSRYRQLNKRIGRMITQIMLYTSDHWLSFRQCNQRLPPAMLERLQVEFDQLFLRAVHCILNAERMGSWQYMTDMPYASVSLETTWKLMWMLHMGQNQSVLPDNLPSVEQCKAELKDPLRKAQLADSLQKMPISEAIYLLTAFSNMVQCRHESETEFIQTITVEVFEIAYLYDHTKDFCSKVGRELLSAIAQVHPVTISFLIHKLRDVRGNIGGMALYLFKELPMYDWQLENADLAILRSWLVSTDLSSTEHLLGRTILSNLNWGLNKENTDLALPLWIHQYVACVLVEAYHNYITSKHLGSVFMEGVKQVALVVRQQQTNEQQFSSWAWELVFKLHLHNDTLPRPSSFEPSTNLVDMDNIPELRKDTFLASVQQGLKVDNPIAMYVAMTMTKYGHDVAEFITHGIPLLSKLNSLYYTKAVIHIIGHCVPMFYNQGQYLIENQEFLKTLHNVLLADETPMRVAKNLISSDFPGAMTKLFNSMILTQIQATNCPADAVTVITLWAHLMLKIPKWSLDRNCCYVLDNLVRSAFRYVEALKKIETLLSEQYQCMLAEYRSQGVVESFVNWIAAGQNLPSFMEKQSLPDAPWLAYLILSIEGKYEECTLLWPTIQQELLSNTKISVEQAWKKSAVKLKLKTISAFHRLNIYRWAQQAVDTPNDHPILPLIWQRFFVLYLGRSITPGSLPERASNGNRFFESLSYRNLLKKMKKKLVDVVQHHIAVLQSAKGSEGENTESPPMSESSSCLSLESLKGECEETLKKSLNTQLHTTLQNLFESFQFWLDEPRLHEATLYLPALPTQYDSERLQKIFFCDKSPWMELIDMNMLTYESLTLALVWTEEITVSYHHQYKQKSKTDSNFRVSTATTRILNRLKTHSIPLGPPPITDPSPPVPEVTVTALEEKSTLMYIINTDLKVLCNHARNFSRQVSRHITMDLEYLDLLPQLYSNEWNQVPVTLECRSTINFTHKCSGSITTSVRVCEKTLNADIQQKLNDIEGQQQVLVQEGLLPPPQKVCVAAVHVENIITTLIKLTRARTEVDKIEHLQSIGCAIFYYLANMVTNETNFYPPTRQFFASCLDILGQEFVQKMPDQSPVLLNFVLDHPDLAGLMSPHFLPNLNPGCFLAMYEKLIVLRSCQIDMAFMLLSKFDVCIWLEKLNLPHPEVVKLIDVLSTAFISCGAEPMSRELILFELFCTHLHKVLNSCFHYYLSQILSMLLKVSSKGRLHVKCWQIFSETAFPYVTECATPGSFDEDYQLQQLSNISAPSASQLSSHQLAQILEMMSSFFMEQRLLNKESCTFGLYSKWHKYVPYIASISAGFLKILAAQYHENLSEESPAQVIDYLWNMIVNVFSPWVRPLKGPAQTQLLIPWTAGDHEAATIMVQNFCDAIRYIHTFYKSLLSPVAYSQTQDILGRLWIFYTSILASRKIPVYCVTLLNVELALLPWDQLTIDLQVAETMSTIRDNGNIESFQLVKVIAPHVNWANAMQDFISNYPVNIVSKFAAHLFHLFLQLAGDDKESFLSFTEEVILMFMMAEKLCWNYLDSNSFSQSVNWYLQHCDPRAILAQRSSLQALELRLIKSASKFDCDSSAHWNSEISKKRVGYVYCVIQLLCQCSYQDDINEETFSNSILNILTEIETVEMAVADRYVQNEESVEMMKTVYSLLNNCNPEGTISELITSTIYSWLESSIHSILLMPAIAAACRSLASLTNVVQILEKCIDVFFTSDGSSEKSNWDIILLNIQIPELNLAEFLEECLQQGAFLTLHAYLIQQLSSATDCSEEQAVIWKVLEWSTKGKSSSDNEGKMLLWWHKCFCQMISQLENNTCSTTDIAQILSAFIHMLTPLAEDKDTTGILGAIGLGRRSTLSIKFRLTCRALYVFLQTTLHPDLTLRVHPEMSIVLHSPGKQALNALRNLKTNRQYCSLITTVNYCSDFVVNPANVFHDSVKLLEYLARSFYSHKGYWAVNLPPLTP
ncbi:ectopic P granules protein 5 homolog [Octopus bimaculoides]|uniref:Ectopic P granules protein 5 homolog n=1 Tax=Octopus bimaculoides TaxID=37653 RepID=A0A0L8I6R2_OCTBM|nr:ectopic P granules protein 5 homolog [Octopus bimaculoides]|eukprot:XP_014790390.1 PREDICTED: ectopic P granules protein 5 homolog [Octopus bimaculoides]